MTLIVLIWSSWRLPKGEGEEDFDDEHDEKSMLVVAVIVMGVGCRYPASGGDEINQTPPRALLVPCPAT